MSTPNPMRAVHVAVNRGLPGSGAPPFLPDQRLGLAEAPRAYTRGSALVNHRDDSGALRAGYVTDLVVLDRDPFHAPPQDLAETRVALTFVGGGSSIRRGRREHHPCRPRRRAPRPARCRAAPG
ncbi:amidohydrolase family protein [Actinoplanes sp. TFC3]|uniref:amidohydrolase family protein n=1 Tax=Actinoplanes sp. TFC3 TaxID=1710355 RepID=UPI001F2398CB|nr:amidohydrolase family protein [Actinoplanes sp. TFC3]